MTLPAKAPKLFRTKNGLTQITLPDGRKKVTQFLGRGRFSNAFLYLKGGVYIYTKHGDLSKDILSHVDRRNNKHIPVMRYLGPMFDGTIDVYRSVYYATPVTKPLAPNSKVWNTVLALRRAHAEACSQFPGNIIAKNQCIDFNYFIAETAQVPDKIREALTLITESAQDWGKTYLFDDFRGKNLGLDSAGRLVFIDAMFDAGLMQKQGVAK